jgi:ATP-dependent Lhr-like helicase
MEESGRCRRGYVVEGLGAAQFAVPGAIDRLRALAHDSPPADHGVTALVLAAADPAQPWGAALDWPATVGESKHRPGRKAGALVVLVDGLPALYVERGGRSLLSFTDNEAALRAGAGSLAGAVREGWLGSLAVERADGVGSLGSHLADVLTEAGFRATPKGLRLRA